MIIGITIWNFEQSTQSSSKCLYYFYFLSKYTNKLIGNVNARAYIDHTTGYKSKISIESYLNGPWCSHREIFQQLQQYQAHK